MKPPSADLKRLLDPKAIAVVGASNREGNIGRIIFERLVSSLRKLYPVHPREASILGHAAISDVAALPDGIDLAVVATGAAASVDAVEACAARGIPFVIIVAGGFSETGSRGEVLEQRLKAVAKDTGCRILGPNSLGIFVPRERLDTIFVEHGDKALGQGGGVAFVTQSGSVGVEALGLASNIGFGLRAFVGLGNKCDLDELDFLNYFGNDRDTSCLAFYLEDIAHGRRFLESARAVTQRKAVIVLKAGRTPTGARAVSSHTGRLAGMDAVIGGAFRQYGVQRVVDDEELCDAAKCLALLPPARGNRVAVLTPAGGFGVMCADYVEVDQRGIPLAMARLSSRTVERIRAATLPYAACENPVDLTASADDAMFGASLDALLADDGVDIIICTAFFAPPAISDDLIETVAVRARQNAKPIITFTQYGPFTDLYLRRFHDEGVVGFPSISRAVRAARFIVERARILASLGAPS
ncbi:MAG: CoA-binding protein [Desulfobacterales bacterium]|nr:CoA-binding protein [Desulfobacterales bacterium]